MQLTKSLGWYEYPFNCICYLLASAVDHMLVFAAGCLVLLLLSLCWRIRYGRLFGPWAVFNLALLLVSAPMAGLWDCAIYGRLYVTADYFSDFSPFVPVTQSVIDVHFDDYNGQLLGVSMRQLQFVWMSFALTDWVLAVWLARRMWSRLTGSRPGEQSQPAATVAS